MLPLQLVSVRLPSGVGVLLLLGVMYKHVHACVRLFFASAGEGCRVQPDPVRVRIFCSAPFGFRLQLQTQPIYTN